MKKSKELTKCFWKRKVTGQTFFSSCSCALKAVPAQPGSNISYAPLFCYALVSLQIQKIKRKNERENTTHYLKQKAMFVFNTF